jgi:hypothetical protein
MNESAWHVLTLLVAAAAIIEAVVIVGILRELGTVLLQFRPARYGDVDEGPQAGSVLEVGELALRGPTLILFMSPSCKFCKPIAEARPSIRRSYSDLTVLPTVVGDEKPQNSEYARTLGAGARTDLDSLFDGWHIPGTPFAVGVSPAGLVYASGVVNSLPQLESMAEEVLMGSEVRGQAVRSAAMPTPQSLG